MIHIDLKNEISGKELEDILIEVSNELGISFCSEDKYEVEYELGLGKEVYKRTIMGLKEGFLDAEIWINRNEERVDSLAVCDYTNQSNGEKAFKISAIDKLSEEVNNYLKLVSQKVNEFEEN